MTLVMPINVRELIRLLQETKHNPDKATELIDGFSEGFDIGYHGPTNRQDTAENIPLKIGSEIDLWNKVMQEVQLNRYAGPYETIPFKNFIQSPIGLVPKSNGKMRLIFHLSYDFGLDEGHRSLNYHTPDDLCSVRYKDLDYAVRTCLRMLDHFKDEEKPLYFGKPI